MDKRIERIKGKGIAVNVKTKKEYINLMKFFERNGIKWVSEKKPTELDYYEIYKDETCIELCNCGLVREKKSYYEREDNKILSFQEFIKKEDSFTKADLRNGDIVTLRNGEKGEYLEFNGVYDTGLKKNNINSDLTNNGNLGERLDIIKVERPLGYETVYERKKEILDEAEKEYLRGVIEPFRNKIEFVIKKSASAFCVRQLEYIAIKFKDDIMAFPNFERGTMYKGMELGIKYTLEELGL